MNSAAAFGLDLDAPAPASMLRDWVWNDTSVSLSQTSDAQTSNHNSRPTRHHRSLTPIAYAVSEDGSNTSSNEVHPMASLVSNLAENISRFRASINNHQHEPLWPQQQQSQQNLQNGGEDSISSDEECIFFGGSDNCSQDHQQQRQVAASAGEKDEDFSMVQYLDQSEEEDNIYLSDRSAIPGCFWRGPSSSFLPITDGILNPSNNSVSASSRQFIEERNNGKTKKHRQVRKQGRSPSPRKASYIDNESKQEADRIRLYNFRHPRHRVEGVSEDWLPPRTHKKNCFTPMGHAVKKFMKKNGFSQNNQDGSSAEGAIVPSSPEPPLVTPTKRAISHGIDDSIKMMDSVGAIYSDDSSDAENIKNKTKTRKSKKKKLKPGKKGKQHKRNKAEKSSLKSSSGVFSDDGRSRTNVDVDVACPVPATPFPELRTGGFSPSSSPTQDVTSILSTRSQPSTMFKKEPVTAPASMLKTKPTNMPVPRSQNQFANQHPLVGAFCATFVESLRGEVLSKITSAVPPLAGLQYIGCSGSYLAAPLPKSVGIGSGKDAGDIKNFVESVQKNVLSFTIFKEKSKSLVIIKLQSKARELVCRKTYIKQRCACILLQSLTRGFAQRKLHPLPFGNDSKENSTPSSIILPLASEQELERVVSICDAETVSHLAEVRVEKSESCNCQQRTKPLTRKSEHTSTSFDDTKHEHNDTFKLVFLGNSRTGKTGIIRKLRGFDKSPKDKKKSSMGLSIKSWIPKKSDDGDLNVKFNVWDFSGQHNHASHEFLFSPRAIYVLVWDMAANNPNVTTPKKQYKRQYCFYEDDCSSSDDEEKNDYVLTESNRKSNRALNRDIDEKIIFWLDCIEKHAPGSIVLPIATYNDAFTSNEEDAERRCRVMKQRVLNHQAQKKQETVQILFGNDYDAEEDVVLKVSNATCTGISSLKERIVNIAFDEIEKNVATITTRMATITTTTLSSSSTFGGYDVVGGRVRTPITVPPLTQHVRMVVKKLLENNLEVITWVHFLGKCCPEEAAASCGGGSYRLKELQDSVQFLLDTGELSVFGGTLSRLKQHDPMESATCHHDNFGPIVTGERFVSSARNQNCTMNSYELICLKPRWLVEAVSSISRHDLHREINEVKQSTPRKNQFPEEGDSSEGLNSNDGHIFSDANRNCPIISANDVNLILQANDRIRIPASNASHTNKNSMHSTFHSLQNLLIQSNVLIPINDPKREKSPQLFFLPSLLMPEHPTLDDTWTYKCSESWMTTLCTSWKFHDRVPSRIMERVIVSVLKDIHATVIRQDDVSVVGKMYLREILCWQTAFLLKLGTQVIDPEDGNMKECGVEIFTHLADQESPMCVAADSTGVGMRRILVSAKGQEGDDGRRIWEGGYNLVLGSVERTMNEYSESLWKKECICPTCITTQKVRKAEVWSWDSVNDVMNKGDGKKRCCMGHNVNTRLVVGGVWGGNKDNFDQLEKRIVSVGTPVGDIFGGVVFVGLWDGKKGKIVSYGTGFVVDRELGLIVTASHVLMNMEDSNDCEFGKKYYGLKKGKVVIGVIPQAKTDENLPSKTTAVLRYFAEIVATDLRNMDACVLRIRTKLEEDVKGNGDNCGNQVEIPLVKKKHFKKEGLKQLNVTETCEIGEGIKIIGYNQGGEGILTPGLHLNRVACFAKGYVCKKFKIPNIERHRMAEMTRPSPRFNAVEEIVAICPTIKGHSGGPCVNEAGEVIGILSRTDSFERRSYMVPSNEFMPLVEKAKQKANRRSDPMQLLNIDCA